jgi:PAS domain S-box-containing protein
MLRILYLNSSRNEALRAMEVLERGEVAAHADVVGDRDEYRRLLEAADHDLIIADERLEGWTVQEAIEELESGGLDTPLVVIADYSGEEESAGQLAGGVTEVVHRDRLAQLPGAVRRAVRETLLRTERTRAEVALRSANQVLTALIRCAPLPITVIARNGTVNVWNPAAEEVLGWGKEEMLGKTLTEVMNKANGLARLLGRSLQQGGVIGAETVQERKDGATVDLRVFSAPLTDRDGEIKGVIGMLTDVTELNLILEAFRESKERFQNAFVYAPIGMAIGSLDGRILRVNPAFCRMLGYEETAVLKLRWKDLAHPDDAELLPMREAEAVRAAEPAALRLRHQNGQTVHVQWNTSVVRDASGRPLYCLGQVVDITESKCAEEQIHRYAGDLERSNRDLQHFAYVASHDLQEPLRMVRGFVELLARRYEGKLGADADEYIHYAVDGATRMQNLIRGLLAYSRVGTQGKSFAQVDSGEALRHALLNLQAAIDESHAAVTCDSLPELPADDVQLAQLFQNLIGNAVKFRSDTPPQVHIGVSEKQDDWEFAVTDNGIGFDPEHANRIFQMFQRLHGQNRYAGTGIGLALCKRIVERHGGKIWVDSAPEKGSTFYFTVPKKEAAAA